MGDRSPDRPAMRRSVETGGGAALDRDPAVTVMGIAAKTIAMEGDPMTIQRIVGTLLHYKFSSDGMNPSRSIDFLQHLEMPVGVSQPGMPTATGNSRRRLSFSNNSKLRCYLSITLWRLGG